MSLYSEAMEDAYILDLVTISDGRGGYESEYKEGALIKAAFSFDTSSESRMAEAAGAFSRYTITTNKSLNLQYHTVLKRSRDGKIFRITSDGDDNYTPASSSLDIRQVEAEEWELPANG